jgi:hypothetical protein
VGRNTVELPPIDDVDLTALKRFTITERFKVEFAAQIFNVLNHPQFVAGSLNDVQSFGLGAGRFPITAAARTALIPGNPNFGDYGAVLSSNARTMQLSLKIFF